MPQAASIKSIGMVSGEATPPRGLSFSNMLQYTFDLTPEDRRPMGAQGGMVRELSIRYLPTAMTADTSKLNRPDLIAAYLAKPMAALNRPDQEAFWVIPMDR